MPSPIVETSLVPEEGQLLPTQTVKVRIRLDTGGTPPVATISVAFASSGTVEQIWDGSTFTPDYAGLSTKETLNESGDIIDQFVVVRTGGWKPGAVFSITTAGTTSGSGVPDTRAINTTVPLTGGGNLTSDRTLALSRDHSLGLNGSNELGIKFAGEAPGDLLVRGASLWSLLPVGTDGWVLKLVAGVPTWAANPAAGVPTARTLQGVSPIAIDGVYSAVDLSANRTFTFAIASEARGDLVYRGASAWVRLAAGTSGYVLKTAGPGADPAWGTLSAADVGAVPTTRTIQGTSPITIEGDYLTHDLSANRTIGFAVASHANGDLFARLGGSWTRLPVGTNGQVLTVSGGLPAWAALASSSITISSATLSGGGTGASFTLNVLYGTAANTALEGSRDTLYVHIAGTETVTGDKTFSAPVVLGTASSLRADTGAGVITAYALSGGVHEFGNSSANVMVNGLTATEIKTGTTTRYVQSATTHSWYSLTALKMTLGSGLHVGTTAVSRSNGEISAATAIIQGTGARDASAILDLQSTALGALLPRLDTTARNAIASPATSLLIYNTTTARHEYYTGSAWAPLGSAAGTMPIYCAGAAGTGPGGSNPTYATLTAMMNAMVADGAATLSPRAGFFVGEFTENPTLRPGIFLFGLGGQREAHTIYGRVDYQPPPDGGGDPQIAGLAHCKITQSSASVDAILYKPQAGAEAQLWIDDIEALCDATSASYAAIHVDGSVAGNTVTLYAKNCAAFTSGGTLAMALRVISAEVNFHGKIIAGATGADQARAIYCDGGTVDFTPGTPEVPLVGADFHVNGSVYVTNAGNVLLARGTGHASAALSGANSLVVLDGSGAQLRLGGNNHIQGGPNTVYHVEKTGAGTGVVTVYGPVSPVDEDSAALQIDTGLTYAGVTTTRPECVQLITAADTINFATTLAIIVAAGASTFAVTMPDPTGFQSDRQLRVKYTGGTNKQDLSLDAATTGDIDYDVAKDSITLAWNDGYHFAAYDGKWVILSRTGAASGGAGGTYTYVPIFKGHQSAVGMSTQYAGGGLFKTAEHDLTGAREIKLRVVMFAEDATVDSEFILQDDAATTIATLNTSSLAIVEVASADLSASFGADVVLQAFIQDANNTVFKANVLSAELVIGPP